jgi:hypothetical protein
VPLVGKVLFGAWVVTSLVLGFAWPGFASTRALYFLALPCALGAAALIARDAKRPRPIEALLAIGLGVGALGQARHAAAHHDILRPAVLEGLAWLRSASAPSNVVVMGRLLGFHAGRLLERPLLVAMEPGLIGNGEELPYAALAEHVLRGGPGAVEAVARLGARFVVVLNQRWEWPEPGPTQVVLRAEPRLRQVFDNGALTVYEILPAPSSRSRLSAQPRGGSWSLAHAVSFGGNHQLGLPTLRRPAGTPATGASSAGP